MTFSLLYEPDFKRIILAVVNDARNTIPATKNQLGTVIYAYAQAQIGLIVPGVLLYRIGSTDGNLGGYLALQVKNGVATAILVQLRPAYQQFALEINEFIANFIISNFWQSDYLI